MNTSIYPNSSNHRAVIARIGEYFTRSEGTIDPSSNGFDEDKKAMFAKLTNSGIRNVDLFAIMMDEYGADTDIKTFGDMLTKVLAGKPITKEERRKIRIYVMRQVAYKSHEFMKSTPVFQPIMDYFQQEALHLVERGVHPAFHDLDKPDNIIPDFKGIPGSVEYMQFPVEYGELVGYVPPISTSRFVYTESWVLDETGKPLFELDKKLRESFNHTSSGYLGNDLFLVFHNSGNYKYTWRIRDMSGHVIAEFKANEVHNLGHGLLFLKGNSDDTSCGIYDIVKRKWILKGEYKETFCNVNTMIILQSKDTDKFGLYDLINQVWIIPCDRDSLKQVRRTKEVNFFSPDSTGKITIQDIHGTNIVEPSLNAMKSLGIIGHFSDSEKFRYYVGLKDDPISQDVSEYYILSSLGEISAGPFTGFIHFGGQGNIFIKDEHNGIHTHVNADEGKPADIQIPGELFYTSEKSIACYILFQEGEKYGIKDMKGNIVVPLQEHPIEDYLPTSGNIRVSRKVATEQYPITDENCPKEYQYMTQTGEVIIPWDRELSSIDYVDDRVQFSCHSGKLVYLSITGDRLVRDIPRGWVRVIPTRETGIYIIEQDADRNGYRYSLYNAEDNTEYFNGVWHPVEKGDNGNVTFYGYSPMTKLNNGDLILGHSVVTPKGEILIPAGSEKITPYTDSNGQEIGVTCQFRNSLMRVIWSKLCDTCIGE